MIGNLDAARGFLTEYRDRMHEEMREEDDLELRLLMSNLVTALDIVLEGSAQYGRIKRALRSV